MTVVAHPMVRATAWVTEHHPTASERMRPLLRGAWIRGYSRIPAPDIWDRRCPKCDELLREAYDAGAQVGAEPSPAEA